MTPRLLFTVYGVAQPKGSARAFIPKGWTRPIITSDNKGLRAWEDTIRAELQRVMGELEPFARQTLFDAPISLSIVFRLPRPKSKPKHVTMPTSRPDLDKCVRGAIDALTGVLFKDDAQVVAIVARKVYTAGAACAEFLIEPAIAITESATAIFGDHNANQSA